MRRRLLPLTLLCAGTSLSHSALADNICLTQAGDPQLTFPGTNNPDVFRVTGDASSDYGLYLCSPTTLDISWFTSYAFGDFNHDGFEDLVFGRSSNSGDFAAIFLNDKAGSGTVVLSTSVPTGAGTAPTGVDVLDLDGNGWDDILTANGSDGTFTVMLNDGHGAFTSVKQYAAGSDVAMLAATDVNGDGNPDVVTESADDKTLSVFLNNGDGTFAAPTTYAVGGPVAMLTVGDVNGDGRPDIFVSSVVEFGSGYIGPIVAGDGNQKFINNGDGTFTASAWQPFSTGFSGGSVSVSGGSVTISATNTAGLFGSGGTVLPISMTSGTGQIKFPTITKVTVVTKSSGTSKPAAGTGATGSNTNSSPTASSGGGGGVMGWLTLALLGLGLIKKKRA